MAKKIVNLIDQEDELLGRLCSINPGSKGVVGFQVVKKGRTTSMETEISIDISGGKIVNEYYVPLDLTKLRLIDSDKQKLREFISHMLPRIKTNSSVNMIIIKLKLEGNEKLETKDIDYLWDMMQITGNDVVVTPIIEYPKGTNNPIGLYSDFVKNFIKKTDSKQDQRIACSIPYSASRRDVGDIIDLYKDLAPQVFILDFGGKKPFEPTQEIIISATLDKIKKTTKENKNDFFLYAYDVKPFKSGSVDIVAENMMLASSGFNAVGPRHTVPPMNPDVIIKLLTKNPNPLTRLKVFEPSDLGYHTISEASIQTKFEKWAIKQKEGLDVKSLSNLENENVTRKLSHAYSYSQLLPEAKSIDASISENTLKKDLDIKVLPRSIIKHVEKIKKGAG